ncbi:hypothetical protein, partial [Desulfatibacillum aliphaticivorans]
ADDNAAMSQDDLDAMFDAPSKPKEKPKPGPTPQRRAPATPKEKGIAPVFQAAGKKKSVS